MMKTFRDLRVWQRAHQFVLELYKSSRSWPEEEKYGLTNQIRRSASSVATNIVEGFKRMSRKDQAHFLNIAESSLEETKYHLLLSRDLGYLAQSRYDELIEMSEEIGRMLFAFKRAILRKVSDTCVAE